MFARLMRPVFVVMLGKLGQDPPEVPLAIDQQVVEALAAQRPGSRLRADEDE